MSTVIRPEISKRSPWYISKHRYYELKHFCLQYPEWQQNVRDLIRYGKTSEIVRTNITEWLDPVGDTACLISYYQDQIAMVNSAAKEADAQLWSYIVKAVTQDLSFTALKMIHNIPCGKDMYYDRYRKFFYILDAKKTTLYIGREE